MGLCRPKVTEFTGDVVKGQQQNHLEITYKLIGFMLVGCLMTWSFYVNRHLVFLIDRP